MTPVKRFEALRSTYMYATYLTIVTNNSFHRTQTPPIPLFYGIYSGTMIQQWVKGLTKCVCFYKVTGYQIVFIYFTFSGAKNILRFAQDFLYGVHYISRLLRSLCLFYVIFICACHVRTPHVNFAVSLLFRCGFASETSPRHIIRSILTHTINGQVS